MIGKAGRLRRAAGAVRQVRDVVRSQQAERERAEVRRAREAAQAGSPLVPPGRLYAAALVDQWLIWGSAIFFLGLAVLVLQSGDHSPVVTVLTLVPIFLVPAVWWTALISSQRGYDLTVGLFLLGLRYGPRRKADRKDFAVNHVAWFWEHLFAWLRDRDKTMNDAGAPGAVLVDERGMTGRAHVLRVVIVLVLLSAPVPLVVALLT